jgi:hypothetical protein
MADVLTSEADENFHLSTWDRDILYADRSSEDEQLLIRLFLRKTKSTNMAGGLNVKFTFCFTEITPEPLDADKRSLVQ